MSLREETTKLIQTGDVPKILVVDDEQPIQKAIEMALVNEGYELFFANNGEEGLKIFYEEAPELIFLDLQMPVMDGYGFIKTVKFKHDSPFTLVVITGHGEDEEIDRCYKMGIDFFLTKPLNMVEICGLTRRCIELKRLEKERVSLLLEVQEARDNLEQRVAERTSELSETITALEEEIKQHEITSKKLEMKTIALEESNIAFQILLKRRDDEKAQHEMEIIGKIEKMIKPYIDRLQESKLNASQKNILDLIDQNLNAIASPFLYNQLSLFIKLTAKEIQISNLIKQGMTTKEIASALDISTRTVETHRYQIRKKIGLKDKKISLRKNLLKIY
jgi:DNA-binding NarL/FixJ family response regulator